MTSRVRRIKGLSLVDPNGLPLVSTMGPGSREESLAALGGAMTVQLERIQRDFEMGPLYYTHIEGRDLQLFITAVNANATLVALVENPATPATIKMHLLALARDIMPLIDQPEEPEELDELEEPEGPEAPEPENAEPESDQSEEPESESEESQPESDLPEKPEPESEESQSEGPEAESDAAPSEESLSEESESGTDDSQPDGESPLQAVAAPHDS